MIQKIDIEQLQGWFTYFFERLQIRNMSSYVDFLNKSSWYTNLQDLSRKDITIGFFNYVNLFELAERNKIHIIKINPQVFKNLCQKSIQ